MNILEINDIEVYIGSFYILQGVSINIKQGEVTVLLGRNGAGKSTTMKAILGLYPPKTGKILYKGNEIKGIRAKLQVEADKNELVVTYDDRFGDLTQ